MAQDNSKNPTKLPTIWEIFSSIRACAADLAMGEKAVTEQVISDLKDIGDYDEPLSALIQDALKGTITVENRRLLEAISEPAEADGDEDDSMPYGPIDGPERLNS